MPKRQNRFVSKIKEFWSNNPILVSGLTLAPAAVAAISLKNAAAISIVMAIVTIPTLIVSSLVKQRLALYHRIPLYACVSAAFFAGAFALIQYLLPTTVETLGIYLPVLIVNTVMIVRAEAFGVRNKTRWVLLDAFVQVLSYGFVICVVGVVREYLGNASLWGIMTDNPLPVTGAVLPFGGFILIGLFAALHQFSSNQAKERRLRAMHIKDIEESAEEMPQAEEVR